MAALHSLQEQGWQVVVSSSGLTREVQEQLHTHDIPVLIRHNIGLCLGAYRDIYCLLSETNRAIDQRPQLVLANDSTLPIGGPKRFIQVLSAMAEKQSNPANGWDDRFDRTRHVSLAVVSPNGQCVPTDAQQLEAVLGQF